MVVLYQAEVIVCDVSAGRQTFPKFALQSTGIELTEASGRRLCLALSRWPSSRL